MTNFQSRLLIGAGYVGATVAATLLGFYSTAIYVGIIVFLALFEFFHITNKDTQKNIFILPALIGLLLYVRLVVNYNVSDNIWLPSVGIGVTVAFLFGFWQTQKKPIQSILKIVGGLLYVVAPLTALVLIGQDASEFNGVRILIVFILIWANDTFAYLVGRQWGKNKLAPTISPKKTIEGFIGGIAAAILISIGLFYWLETYSLQDYIVIALISSVIGTMGDLFESKIKRNLGIKDSGIILGGHGGILDRMDSILFAAPSVYLYLYLVQNL